MLLRKVARLSVPRPCRPTLVVSRCARRTFYTSQLGGQRYGNSIGKHFFASVRTGAIQPQSTLWSTKLLLTLLTGGAGFGTYVVWVSRRLEEEISLCDIELPLMPEPQQFVHPYESWSWYQRAWFTVKRSVFLAYVFTPFVFTSTAVLIFPENQRLREIWLEMMCSCMQRAGAAFQKFGQWLSMRPDMFPPDVLRTLAKLRCDAPSHSGEVSREVVCEQLGYDMDELFEEFDMVPIASGSVGQVHHALLKPRFALDGNNGRLRDVAVKVQHPGVADSAFMDLDILWKVVDLSTSIIHMTMPFNRGEFDTVIQAQMDFKREAFNLQKFKRNFKGERRIRFPQVSPLLVTPKVLIETWAEGKVISNILEDFDIEYRNAKGICKETAKEIKAKVNELKSEVKEIKTEVKVKIETEVKDIKAKVKELRTDVVETAEEIEAKVKEKKRVLQLKLCGLLYDMSMKMMMRDNFVHGDLHGGNILYSEADDHVTVLDAGIATSLEKKTVAPFGSFLHALCSGNTELTVKYLELFNESKITVNVPNFTHDIQETMDKFMGPLRANPESPINAADMFGEVMFTMQRYGMLLKGDVASTLFTISISEGLIRQLDPSFDVAQGALPYIVRHMPLLFLGGSDAEATRTPPPLADDAAH